MRAVVMTVFDSAAIGECSRAVLLSQVVSGLSKLWRDKKSSCASEYGAFLQTTMKYYSPRDRANHLTTGARMVESYLDSVGLRPSSRAAVPARYLSARFACRILADVHRIGVAVDANETVTAHLDAHCQIVQLLQSS